MLTAARLETAATWEQDGWASGAARKGIGAGDATFVARMLLGPLALATGSRLLAEVADDRPYPTWQGWGEERLKGLGPGVLYGGSARAQALLQRAAPGLAGVRLPDVFMSSMRSCRARHGFGANAGATRSRT